MDQRWWKFTTSENMEEVEIELGIAGRSLMEIGANPVRSVDLVEQVG